MGNIFDGEIRTSDHVQYPTGTRKVLRLLRHSEKRKDGFISDKGHDMAVRLGQQMNFSPRMFTVEHLFYNRVPRTIETALSFLAGSASADGNVDCAVHSPIEGLGSPEFFSQLNTPAYRELFEGGMNGFDAAKKIHPQNIKLWADAAIRAVDDLFDSMPYNENIGHREGAPVEGLGFFNTPCLQFISYYLNGMENELPEAFRKIKVLDGIQLYQDGQGDIAFGGRVVNNIED